MKINKLSDLFDINFTPIRYKEILKFFKLCTKYHSRLFDDNFFRENFSTPEKFLNFIKNFKNNIFFVLLGKEEKFAGFFYLYDIKKIPNDFYDAKVTFCICRPYWGFGSYAIAKKGLRFLFEIMRVRKLTIEIVGENSYAWKLIEKLEFEYEATLKKECFKAGKAENLYIFSKFNPAI